MNAAMKKAPLSGVLKHSLKEDSHLLKGLKPGLRAMGEYSGRVEEGDRKVVDSLDLDEATRLAHPNAHRWDYILGVSARTNPGAADGGTLIGIEVHSATDREISVVIAKKQHSKFVLLRELHPHATVKEWLWIASGWVRFSPNSKNLRLLAQQKIKFVGSTLRL